jgi:diguanylate cyclase (GGDEF)-like protein/PAS domain S-box-containing protein
VRSAERVDNPAAQALTAHEAAALIGPLAPVALWVADASFTLITLNETYSRFTGRAAQRDLGLGWTELLHAEDAEAALAVFRANAREGGRYQGEYRLRRHDGAYRWVRSQASPWRDAAGRLQAYVGASLDISDLRAAREAEAAVRERLELAIAGTQDGIFDWPNMAWPGFWCSPRACELVGYAPREFDADKAMLFRLLHAADRAGVEAALARAAAAPGNLDLSFRLRCRTGRYRWLRVRARVTQNAHGKPRLSGAVQDIDDQPRANTAIAQLQRHVDRALDAAGIVLWDWDIQRARVWRSAGGEGVLGYHPADDPGDIERLFRAALHPDDQRPLARALAATLHRRQPFEIDVRLRHRADGYRWCCAVGVAERDRHGRVLRLSGSLVDVDERRRARDMLAHERTKALVTLDAISDAVVTTDAQGRIDFLNASAERLLGIPRDELSGRVFGSAIHLLDDQDHHALPDPAEACLMSRKPVRRRSAILRGGPQREEHVIEYSAMPLTPAEGPVAGVVVALRNVTEERRLAEAMSYQATHDALTGLVNRPEFERRLERVLRNAMSTQTEHALCYLDLDQFKIINDSCGHGAGDELLRQVAVILGEAVRKRDTVGRLGGDEFGILMEHCSLHQANRVAQQVRQRIAEHRFRWNEHVFGLGISIGLVQITEASGSMANLFKHADAACYVAKEHGRNRVHVYDPGDITMERRRGEMRWVSRLTTALNDARFKVQLQPTRILDGRAAPEYVEVLVRLPDHDRVHVPGEFLPAAERYNLASRIDRWVFDYVLEWYKAQRLRINPDALFAINLSAASLSDESLLEWIEGRFSRLGVPPERFCFEITETAAIGTMARAQQFFQALRARGCHLALDDFGSGLSSFSYLRNMPVDFLKIDGQFVRDCVSDPIDLAMVRSINDIGHVIGVQTVAEFVETEEIAELMRQIGVDYAQGHAISRPLDPADYLAAGPALTARR